MKKEKGAALVLTLIVLVFLSVIILGLAKDIGIDLNLTRNLKLIEQASDNADSGLFVAEELIAYAIDSRGDDNGTALTVDYDSVSYKILNSGDSLFSNNSTMLLQKGGETIAVVDIQKLGVEVAEGGSILIAAGYEGIGKGAGSGTGAALIYRLVSTGNSTWGKSVYKSSELYRYVSGGK
jgi:Tfp pilus assembly protein PilX